MLCFWQYPSAEDAAYDLLDAHSMSRQFNETVQFWRGWAEQSKYSGRWREIVNRSALALKLLTSHEHGSVAAAATFGLPELPGGSRNWDYRYSWLRDASFSMYAFMRLGFTKEASAFTMWLRDRVIEGLQTNSSDGPLKVVYRIDGSSELKESTLDHLAGMLTHARCASAMKLARNCNWISMAKSWTPFTCRTNTQTVSPMMAGGACVRWLVGWELIGTGRMRVSGRCAGEGSIFFIPGSCAGVAMDRAIRLSQKRSLVAPLADWLTVRDAIHDDIFANFWSEQQKSFVQSKGSETIDASALMMPLVRFISPTDPRWLSTMSVIEKELTEDALVYRYSTNDGLDVVMAALSLALSGA